jgi:hypothetical protein
MMSRQLKDFSIRGFAEANSSNFSIEEGRTMKSDFAAFVAIDWADQKHAWMLQAVGSIARQAGTIDHTPEAVAAWAAELRLRFDNCPIAVAVEQARGPLVFMLSKFEHLVIFPVHPTTLANYRKSFRPSGVKDDPNDAALLLDVLTLHHDKLRRLRPDTPETRTLQFLVEERRKFVDEKTRCSNRITSHLKLYYPQVLEWFDEIGSNIAAEFLEHWPSLDKLQRAKPATIERFFIDHNSRNPEYITRRLDQIRKATQATSDPAVITSCAVAVVAWAGLLKQPIGTIASYDDKIDALAPGLCTHQVAAGASATANRSIGKSARQISNGTRSPVLHRDSTSGSEQWQAAVGSLALVLSNISAPDLSRVGSPFNRLFSMGP